MKRNLLNDLYICDLYQVDKEIGYLSKSDLNPETCLFDDKLKKYKHLTNVDRNIIENFVDNIYVYNDKSIDIEFKFKSEYEEALSYLKNSKNMI